MMRSDGCWVQILHYSSYAIYLITSNNALYNAEVCREWHVDESLAAQAILYHRICRFGYAVKYAYAQPSRCAAGNFKGIQ